MEERQPSFLCPVFMARESKMLEASGDVFVDIAVMMTNKAAQEGSKVFA